MPPARIRPASPAAWPAISGRDRVARAARASSGGRRLVGVGCGAAAVGAARLGVADRADDRGDGVLEGVAVGRDDPGVVGDPQRRHGAGRVEVVAAAERLEDRLRPRGSSGSRPRSSVRRRARSSTEASRKSLRSASGRTTVPMSRPAMTIPPSAARSRWRASRAGPDLRRRPRPPRPRRRPPGRARRRCGRRRRRRRGPGGRSRPARARPRRRGRRGASGSSTGTPAGLGQPGHGPVQQARVAEAVADARARRPRRRCSCPTSPVRRARRRASRASTDRGGGCRRSATRDAAADRPPEAADLGRLERPDRPAAQAVDADGPDPDADEPLDRRADRAEHPAQLALPALGRAWPGTRSAAGGGGSQERRRGVRPRSRSSAAGRPSVGEALVERDARPAGPSTWSLSSGVARPSAYSRSTPWRGWRTRSAHAAVVGEQEHALGVLVEAADRVEPRAVGHERGRARGRAPSWSAWRSRVVEVTPAGLCSSR